MLLGLSQSSPKELMSSEPTSEGKPFESLKLGWFEVDTNFYLNMWLQLWQSSLISLLFIYILSSNYILGSMLCSQV
jgi:hypothetical protein